MTSRLLLNPPVTGPTRAVRWSNLHGAGLGLAIAEAARLYQGLVLVVLDDPRQLQIVDAEIRFFLANGTAEDESSIELLNFPSWECLPYDVFSPHQDITSERLRLLSRLNSVTRGILLTSTENMIQRLPPVDYVFGHSFSLKRGESVDLDSLRERLANANYVNVSQVLSPGEFAVRGGLIDVFPTGADSPFRLDLFDDEIESIRYFDPDTQRSAEPTDQIELLPAREFPITEAGIKTFRQAFRRSFEGDPRRQTIYNEVSDGRTPAGTEFFFPLFFETTATLFDYLPDRTLWVLEQSIENSVRTNWAEINDRYVNANYDPSRKVLPPEALYLNPDHLIAELKSHDQIIHST
ncbi:MAG: transcription-repair coupling factor, partial [bacterium]